MAEGYRLADLAARLGGRLRGSAERRIRGIAPLERAGPEELSFFTNPKYRPQAESSRAGALIVAPDRGIEGRDVIEVADPYLAVGRAIELLHPAPPRPVGVSGSAQLGRGVRLGESVAIGPFAVIGDEVELGERVVIGAGSVVGDGCCIGADAELKPHVVLYPGVRIGPRCLIHAGVVLGGDGFGFATVEGVHHKIPQVGDVELGADVEIGANTTVDRGTLDTTRIGAGSKLDNLVMVAHGVQVGAGALLAGQCGIAGSTRLGDHTVWAGQTGAAGHLEIAAGTVVAAKSAVLGDVPHKQFLAGVPAVNHREWKRAQALVRRLPEMRRELRELRQRLDDLERRPIKESDS